MRLTVKILIFLSLTLAFPTHAHTRLSHSEPQAGQMLHESPSHLRLHFSSPVYLFKLTISDNKGMETAINLEQLSDAQASFEFAMSQLTAGEYIVHWTIMGADGHKMSGTLPFAIMNHAHH